MRYRNTPDQRAEIDRLLRKLEMDTPSFTLQHQAIWTGARLATFDLDLGKPLAQKIDELSFQQAHQVIDALKLRAAGR